MKKYKILISEDRNIFTTAGSQSRKSLNEDGELIDSGTLDFVTGKIDISDGYLRISKSGRVCFYYDDDSLLELHDVSRGQLVQVPECCYYMRFAASDYVPPSFIETEIITHRVVTPIYGNNVALEYNREGDNKFFRKAITGEFTFCGGDYDFIMQRAFDYTHKVIIVASDDNFASAYEYAKGKFTRTDCTINEVDKTLKTSLTSTDVYDKVLAGLDREFSVTKLYVAKSNVLLTRRPMLQIYAAGESTISCFYDRTTFETDIESTNDFSHLINDLHFEMNISLSDIVVRCWPNPSASGTYSNGQIVKQNPRIWIATYSNENNFRVAFKIEIRSDNGVQFDVSIINPNGTTIFEKVFDNVTNGSHDFELQYNQVFVACNFYAFGARYVCDATTVQGKATFEITANDPVADNRNYTHTIGVSAVNILLSIRTTSTRTQYGVTPNGMYYQPPSDRGVYYPIGRTYWSNMSIWFEPSTYTDNLDIYARSQMLQKDFLSLGSVIGALLQQIDTNVSHAPSQFYSQFLYGFDPITSRHIDLMITPKSNVLAGEYQTPDLQAKIKLSDILNMLRSAYNLYWFIEDGALRIEHISYFENGGTYNGSRQLGEDLTATRCKNGYPWAYGSNEYTFDKGDMPQFYKYAWSDEVTQEFSGYPIEVLSDAVQEGNTQDVTIGRFTSDVDYMLLNPQGLSQDGFVVIDAAEANGLAAPDTPYSGGSRGTAVLTPYKKINKTFAGTNSRLAFSLSGTAGARAHIVFLRGDTIIKEETEDILADGDTYERVVTIPADADAISYRANGQSVTAKTFALANSHIKATQFYEQTIDGVTHVMQNGTLSMVYLQPNYLCYDMPAARLRINNAAANAKTIKRTKTSDVTFASENDPNTEKLVRTNIGDGLIDKMTVNLASRETKITLKYETE